MQSEDGNKGLPSCNISRWVLGSTFATWPFKEVPLVSRTLTVRPIKADAIVLTFFFFSQERSIKPIVVFGEGDEVGCERARCKYVRRGREREEEIEESMKEGEMCVVCCVVSSCLKDAFQSTRQTENAYWLLTLRRFLSFQFEQATQIQPIFFFLSSTDQQGAT